MATSEDTTLVIKRDTDGKMRVASRHWEAAKVLSRNEVFEVRTSSSRGTSCAKERKPDEWDPLIAPYDLYGPGVSADVSVDETEA
jgi:hypothetical protein